MADVPIQFGPWEPDKAPHQSPALTEATNVLPLAGAYIPFPSLSPVAGAVLDAPATGFYAAPLLNGTPLVFAATANQIVRIDNGATTVAYDAGGIATAAWRFTSFKGSVIAVNPYANPLGAAPGGMFEELGGDPPRAKVVGVVAQNFLVLGNLQNDGPDGLQPNRIRWSGFNNADTWGTNVGTQADFQPMPDEGGPVISITGRETGTVFQRNAITRMQYVGGATVFDFTTVELNRGAISAGAVCDIGGLIFFIADDGFFVWDGTSSVAIGSDKVDRTFNELVDHNRLDAIVSGFDPVTRSVLWAFPEVGNTAPSTIFAYSIPDGRWSRIDVPLQQITQSATLAAPIEGMPTPDLFDGTFDDPSFAGGRPILAAIDSNNQYCTFEGPSLASTITTGDFQTTTNMRGFVSGVRPLVDTAQVRMAVGERDQRSADAVTWNTSTALERDGVCPQRVSGRYMRFRQTTEAGAIWSRATGIELRLTQRGRR
jgi:hypothetical protein